MPNYVYASWERIWMAVGYGLDERGSVILFLHDQDIYLFSREPLEDLGPKVPSV